MAIDGRVRKLIADKEKRMNSEQVFSPRDNTTEHILRFESPIEDFTSYQEPSALLVEGIVDDRGEDCG